MKARAWTAATGLCLASLLGCSEEGHTPAAITPTPTVSILASASSVVADGTNTVTLTVTDSESGPVDVVTTKGTFVSSGTATAQIAGASGTLTLRTCDAATDLTCASTVTVTATSAASGASDDVAITFGSLAALCPSNCAADDGCAGSTCNRSGGGTGTCSSPAALIPSTCLVTSCSPSEATETSCDDAEDNDCDGLVDCNDSTCSADPACNAPTPLPPLGSLQIPEPAAEFAVMGAKDSGWNELGAIMVQALDATGKPYPDGLTVTFTHRPLGGSTLVGGTLAPGVVTYDAVTQGGEGVAVAYLRSGTSAGTLVVTATATGGSVTRTATLPTVTVVGAKASGANFSVVCNPRNVPALAETDCSTSWVDAPFTCAALLKDRYNNLLGTQTQVVFASEAAAVGQIATTPAYDPGADPTAQDQLGNAIQIFETLGAGLPVDVDPTSSEKIVTHGLDGCGVRDHHPRDGVVTILAVADGEEAFFDANGNGRYDGEPTATPPIPLEPFVDQGEPFVDQDDNGAWDPGEWFLDVDGSGDYTDANGKWDDQTKIWTQTVVVYTGKPGRNLLFDATATPPADPPTYLGSRWVDAGNYFGACSATEADPGFRVESADKTVDPPLPPSQQDYVVIASDWNLNVLHSGTTYAVKAEEGAKVKVTYRGKASYADDLGFMYRYWPCTDPAVPSTCSAQCRSGTCFMTPTVDGFSCGLSADVTIVGGDEPDPVEVTVEWTVNTPWFVYDNSKFVEAIVKLDGYNTADGNPIPVP